MGSDAHVDPTFYKTGQHVPLSVNPLGRTTVLFRPNPMELSAAAPPSRSLYLPPANDAGKTKPRFQLQRLVNNNSASSYCKAFCTLTAPKLHGARFSLSRACRCTDESGHVAASSNNPKGWVHFVGIGGCGLSALAMLALQQVTHYILCSAQLSAFLC